MKNGKIIAVANQKGGVAKIRGYSAKDKESAYMKLLPAIMEKNNICWLRVNNEIRSKYKVDISIASNSHILVKK